MSENVVFIFFADFAIKLLHYCIIFFIFATKMKAKTKT